LRKISSRSIAEIKEAAAQEKPIMQYNIFGNDWENMRVELVYIHSLHKQPNKAPFTVIETETQKQKRVTAAELVSKFAFWRSIELENQMNSDLENGYISEPREFEPHDQNWFNSNMDSKILLRIK
jgi:hypothetical protein